MSELARRLIDENKRTRATFLDLGNCGLTKLPEEVGELVWLEGISFSWYGNERTAHGWRSLKSTNSDWPNALRTIGPLGRLTKLQSVVLRRNPVADFSPLANLHRLQALDVSNTQIADLSPLARETADASMSRTRSQDEYNKLIRDCDIFVCLVFTKAGRYTVEEFNTAHEQFVRSGRPAIYTFFKDAAIQAGAAQSDDFNSRRDFQKKLDGLDHFYSTFKSTEDLLLQFTEQLKKRTRAAPM